MLVQALCVAHLLFGAVVWSPVMPVTFTMSPTECHPIAHPLQVAYNALLRWALDLPRDTHTELLHAMANLPPAVVLVAKQLVRYRAQLLRAESGAVASQSPHRERLAHRVWMAIRDRE